MLVADVVRGIAVASLPLAYALGSLTLVHLYAVAFVTGTLDVTFYVAYGALLVSLVPRDEYLEANALLNGSRSFAQIVGMGAGGILVALLTAPGALLLDAASFLVSGLQLARIRPVEPEPQPQLSQGQLAGVRWIMQSAVVRRLLGSTATVNLFGFMGTAILVLYAHRTLGLGPAVIGLVFGAGAVGGVLGAATCRRLDRRVGLGRAFVVGSVLFPAAMLLFPLASGQARIALMVAGEALGSVGVMWLDITAGAIFAQEIPDGLRSRVAGAYRTVNYGVRPLGAVTGGLLGASIGLRATLWVSAGGALLAVPWLLAPAVLGLRRASAGPDPRGPVTTTGAARTAAAPPPVRT
jgi:predicted MFS family arabinose efflux permease